MSRSMLVLILLLVIIVGGAIFLANVDTEVVPQRVEKEMLNDAQPR